MPHALDNPIWHALTSQQASLAVGDSFARRFPQTISPLAGMIDQSNQAYASLMPLAQPGESLVLFLDQPAQPPGDWILEVSKPLTQMIFEHQPLPGPEHCITELSDADVPEMLSLTRLTQPGPFRQQTHLLGTYLGIKVKGRLAAMAGERLKLNDYSEVSAVCTHPDFQGRGYAQTLATAICNRILERGELPFLHTGLTNTRAITIYEKLGFRQRRLIHLAVLRHPASLHVESVPAHPLK
jgi:GNAT superfamily N-acetyltransferase